MAVANKQMSLFPEPRDHLEVSSAATTYFFLRAFLQACGLVIADKKNELSTITCIHSVKQISVSLQFILKKL